jgi:hypothetical protein
MIELKDIINTMVRAPLASCALLLLGPLADCRPVPPLHCHSLTCVLGHTSMQVDRLANFADEVERVSLEVGTEG